MQALTPEEKAVYKQIEKSERENPTHVKCTKGGKKKLTGLGESVDEIDREKERKQKFENTMKDYINVTIKRGKQDDSEYKYSILKNTKKFECILD